MNVCLFAGTFDPITIGHVNVIEKCIKQYNKVILVIGQNPQKSTFFSEEQRFMLVKQAFKDNPNVEVYLYSQYKDDYLKFLKDKKVTVYARGIRNQTDIDFERNMEQANKVLYPFIKTEFIYCDNDYKKVSSSTVKNLIERGENYLQFIPSPCKNALSEILKQIKS